MPYRYLYGVIAVAILGVSISVTTQAQVTQTTSTENASEKAKREELIRKNAEIEANNRKIIETNDTLARTFNAGNQALTGASLASKEKRSDDSILKYSEAIARYDEGLAVDPAQPAILTNKALALNGRGVERYNTTVKPKTLNDAQRTAGIQAAKNDFKAAVEAATTAVSLIKAQTPPIDFAELQKYNANKYAALLTRAEAMRLFVIKVDPTQVDAGYAALKDYMLVETDPVKKSKIQLDLAQMLLDAEARARALVEFQVILRSQPDNLEANLGAGLALYTTDDKTKFPEAAKYLQYFVDRAPDTNDKKAYAKEILVWLRDGETTTSVGIKPSSRKRP